MKGEQHIDCRARPSGNMRREEGNGAGATSMQEVTTGLRSLGITRTPTTVRTRSGRRKENELGLFDMSGNAREWVQDCWHDNYVGAPGDGRAWEDGNCARRVIRGGGWYGKPSYVRSANRFWYTTYFRNNNLGFRLALTPDK